jgi:hypothetical protein
MTSGLARWAVAIACGVAGSGLASGCSSSSSSSPAGAIDAAADSEAASDAAPDVAGCESQACCVMTCSGMVALSPGETIPMGDTCGANTCSFQSSGGLGTCGCNYENGCDCPDSGP